jgi:hypothetical protein
MPTIRAGMDRNALISCVGKSIFDTRNPCFRHTKYPFLTHETHFFDTQNSISDTRNSFFTRFSRNVLGCEGLFEKSHFFLVYPIFKPFAQCVTCTIFGVSIESSAQVLLLCSFSLWSHASPMAGYARMRGNTNAD